MCFQPIRPPNAGGRDVPCGYCFECLTKLVSNWSFRLGQEAKLHSLAHFVTLTYGSENLPITDNGFPTLSKRDVQNFFKRLRKRGPSGCVRYFVVGEYGTSRNRPHYHALIFGAQVQDIAAAWGVGSVYFGSVTSASIGYTLGYVMFARWTKAHSRDDRLKPFRLMSKRLGANYLTDAMVRWHLDDLYERMYCNLPGGVKVSMPRYYKDRIYNEEERFNLASVYEQRAVEAIQEAVEQNPNYLTDRQALIAQKQDAMHLRRKMRRTMD